MKWELVLSILLSASLSTAQESKPAVSVPRFPNASCPIMGKPASTRLFVETPKGRIYVCCVSCNKKIRADPDVAHKAAYPTIKQLQNEVCPVSAKPIEKTSLRVVLQGYEFSVHSSSEAKAALEESQIVLAKVTNPKLRDIGNVTCPVTDKPVEKNAFCIVQDSLVRLSSAECADEVAKDPAAIIIKAMTLVPKKQEPPKN